MAEALAPELRAHPVGVGYYPGAAVRKTIVVSLGDVSVTGGDDSITFPVFLATHGRIKVLSAAITVSTTVAADGSNYWTFTLQNRGADGTGATALQATPPDNSATAITEYVDTDLAVDQNELVDEGTVLALDVAETGTGAAALDGLTLFLEILENV